MTLEVHRAALALVSRGLVSPEVAAAVPVEALGGAAALLAWTCACHAARLHGRTCTFRAVRMALATVPRPAMPLETWGEIWHEAEAEIDAAERLETLDPRAVEVLIFEGRAVVNEATEAKKEGDHG